MKRNRFLFFSLIGSLILSGCVPRTSEGSSKDSSHLTSNYSEALSESSDVVTSEQKEAVTTITKEMWVNNFTPGYFDNFTQHTLIHSEELEEGVMLAIREVETTFNFASDKITAYHRGQILVALDFDLIRAVLEAMDELDNYAEIVAEIVSYLDEHFGKPTIKDDIHYYVVNEEAYEAAIELYADNHEFAYYYELLQNGTHERFIEEFDQDTIYDNNEFFMLIRDEYDSFTYNEQTKAYEAILDIEDYEFTMTVSFADDKFIAADVDVLIEDEDFPNYALYNNLHITHTNYDETVVKLPAVFVECGHKNQSYAGYLYSENSHYRRCTECWHIAVIEPHEYVDGYCIDCDHYPHIMHDILLDGYTKPFGYYVVNTLTEAIEEVTPFINDWVAHDEEWRIYESSVSADVHVYSTDKLVDDEVDPCSYTWQKYVKFVEHKSGKVLAEYQTNSGFKYENHSYNLIREYEDENCERFVVYECQKCGKEQINSYGFYHDFEFISETVIDACHTTIVERCRKCHKVVERIITGEHDYYIHFVDKFNEYGTLGCTKCGNLYDVSFWTFATGEKSHYIWGYTKDTWDSFDLSGLHEFDQSGKCIVCGSINTYTKTTILDEYGYTIYAKYVGPRLVDFYLAGADDYNENSNYYYLNDGVNVVEISEVNWEVEFIGDDIWETTTFNVTVNGLLYTKLVTEVVTPASSIHSAYRLINNIKRPAFIFFNVCHNC